MAFDWGYIIAGALVAYLIAIGYKKKTGQPVSILWKDKLGGKKDFESPTEYRKVYVTKGIKQ